MFINVNRHKKQAENPLSIQTHGDGLRLRQWDL